MRPLAELINIEDPAWPLVKGWIDSAKNKVQVLPRDTAKADDALLKTQVTTRSPMGAIVYETGGLLIDGGWIRILGSGSSGLNRSLPYWNKGKTIKEWGDVSPYWLIADDAVGGFFAINGGGLGADAGKVYYLAPDTLEWESLGLSYSDFLMFCFSGNLQAFYKTIRWKSWQNDLIQLKSDQAFSFYPYLWTSEGKDIEKDSRKPVPVEEIFTFTADSRKQMGIR
ncbi:DUF2625 domain-containing protein [Mucilaginibacter yixingensis]|nr:DUF2625 domain-containing protein [Mucilaginibacter yixingensis]